MISVVKGMIDVVPLSGVDSTLVLIYPGLSRGKLKIFYWWCYSQDCPCVVKKHILQDVTLLIQNMADLDSAGR